jgi:U3 small nucleolar RNA-associated protein 13
MRCIPTRYASRFDPLRESRFAAEPTSSLLVQIWALALSNDEQTLVTGGTDSTLNVWADCTLEELEQEQKRQQQVVLKEQALANAIRRKDYNKAILYTFDLEQPRKMYSIFRDIVHDPEGKPLLRKIVASLKFIRICKLLRYIQGGE